IYLNTFVVLLYSAIDKENFISCFQSEVTIRVTSPYIGFGSEIRTGVYAVFPGCLVRNHIHSKEVTYIFISQFKTYNLFVCCKLIDIMSIIHINIIVEWLAGIISCISEDIMCVINIIAQTTFNVVSDIIHLFRFFIFRHILVIIPSYVALIR